MTPANDNRSFSTLPTFHPVRMEETRIAAEDRDNPAALAAVRAAWLKARGL